MDPNAHVKLILHEYAVVHSDVLAFVLSGATCLLLFLRRLYILFELVVHHRLFVWGHVIVNGVARVDVFLC